MMARTFGWSIHGSAIVAVAAVLAPAQASAQQTEAPAAGAQVASVASAPDMFGRTRNVSVAERPRPGYEAVGARVGGFMVYPKVEIQAGYTDNLLATNSNTINDTYARIRPELAVSSQWSRHAINAFARASATRYNENSAEDVDAWAVGAGGRVDIARQTYLAPTASFSELTEPRTAANSPFSAAAPIQFKVREAGARLQHISNRFKLSLIGNASQLNYEDGRTPLGGTVEQDQRDRSVYTAIARVDYAVSPDTAVFVQVGGNDRPYRLPSTATYAARNSSGYDVFVGSEFDLGLLFRGEVAAGYIKQSYDDVRYDDVDGAAVRARVEYFPSQLTTVSLTATRSIEDSAAVGSAGILSTDVKLAADYELRRNIVLHAEAGVGQDEFRGIDRTDDRWMAGVEALYLINRRLGASIGYRHQDRSSGGAFGGQDYSANSITVSLVSQF
ncbi:hypothetical protein MMB232_01153 [Brevundimonas subvibrioides]|uniref:outer membrane beta-barrel protein n=1 Tax=Brevundimonas subvibrioides TaxID=74313 RepID=UPI0032D58E61